MTASTPSVHFKPYRTSTARHTAEQNYRWLAGLGTPARLPGLLSTAARHLGFEHITGRPARPGDLITLAGHLGDVHGAAYAAALHRARLHAPFRTPSGHLIPGFLGPRLAAVTRTAQSGSVPGAAFSPGQAACLLRSACQSPAALYKDANPRNFLITTTGPVTIDFDDLTLAPFGYDLAKLIVTLAMTHGPLPPCHLARALQAYSTAARRRRPELVAPTWQELMAWADIHHLLTNRYLGRGGYKYSWHQLRPPPQKGLTA